MYSEYKVMNKNQPPTKTKIVMDENEKSLREKDEVTMVRRNATEDTRDTRGSNKFQSTKGKVPLLVGQAKHKNRSSVPSSVFMLRNGRRRVRRGVRARCASRLSNCRSVKKTLQREYGLSINLFRYRKSYTARRSFIIEKSVQQFLELPHQKFKNKSGETNCETVTVPSLTFLLPSDTKLFRKRRVGIVENQYDNEKIPIFSPIRDLIHRFTELLTERGSWREYESSNGFEMKSKNLVNRDRPLDDTSDLVKANEQYDEFNVAKMAVARSHSKSSQSDEGIEPDTIRRNNSFRRCWSLDSAAPSEEDILQNVEQQKEHKLQVSRCCSSDSAVLSDEDHNKGWENSNLRESGDYEFTEGQPRFWRTPSVVVSDYSDYSYLEEKFERSNLDLDKFTDKSGTPSQASSCSCLDCDEIREFNDIFLSQDNKFLQICRHRRHSDSCYLCIGSTSSISERNVNKGGNRRNSCLASSSPYSLQCNSRKLGNNEDEPLEETQNRTTIDLLELPPPRKISDCSTNSSLSEDDFEVTELLPVRPTRTSGWRKLRNIVQWTPFFQTYKKQRYPWVQLAGHQGNFRAGPTPGTILKKLCPQEEACFRLLMHDVLRPYVPEFKGVLDVREMDDGGNQEAVNVVADETEVDNINKKTTISSYLQLQDLLGEFEQPCVMDCKVGVRTYLESELAKAKERPKLRKDMYEKMIQVDPSAPSAEERRVQGVTKPRYMVWRETISSTATLGFRVEGIKLAHGGSFKDFKTTRTREQVTEALKRFVEGYTHAVPKYLQRLKAIRATLQASPFFASHEVVGSSLLFVHDATSAGVWMIDFAKTLPLPQHLPRIRHDAEWQVGNHEDGYLIGVNNLIDIFQDIRNSET